MLSIRWNTFPRSLCFALGAAGAALPWWLAVRPILGGFGALATYAVAVVAAYLAGLARERGRAAVTLMIALGVGSMLVAFARSLTELALGEAVFLAVARSGFLYRMPAARAVVVELVITGGGLLFARFLSGGSLASLVLVPWGFFLVQSLYFLVGGVAARSARCRAHPDPFDDAHARAVALLERSAI